MAYSIQIGSATIAESNIVGGSIKISTAVDIVGDELSADVFTAVIIITDGSDRDLFVPSGSDGFNTSGSGLLYAVGSANVANMKYGTPVSLYDGTTLVGKFYLRNIVRIGHTHYQVNAMSAIGFLENQKHYGGIYTNATVSSVLGEIIDGAFPYSIQGDVVNQIVSGWLPIDTKRNNLHKLLFALGITIKKDVSTGNLSFVFLSNSGATSIPNNRIFLGGNVDYSEVASAAEVTEHAFYQTSDDETVTLFDNTGKTAASNTMVEFGEPYYDLSASGDLVIDTSHVNYAVVSGNGILTGKKYTHDKRVIRRETGQAVESEKVISSHDDTLVNVLNSGNVLDRLVSYYTSQNTVRASIKLNGEKCGDVVSFENAFGEQQSGIITSMESLVSTFIRASSTIVTNYEPIGQGNNYTNRTVITTNSRFTVPSGTRRVRMVLIAPGNGGDGGYDGEDGMTPPIDWDRTGEYNSGHDYSDQYWNTRQVIAHGGAGGQGGTQGKVYIAEYETSGGEQFNVTIGSRGSAGARNGGTGGTGGNVSVSGAYSASTTNGSLVNGYYDPITNETYALPGQDGISGGDGGTTDIISLISESGEAGNPGGDAGNYRGGAGGRGESGYLYSSTYKYKASGGGGGGASNAANGENGGDASAYYTIVDNLVYMYAFGGNGGNGANASAPPEVLYGCGGGGGNGGGGGGNGGGCVDAGINDSGGTAGTGGQGTAGAQGGAGCAIFYY